MSAAFKDALGDALMDIGSMGIKKTFEDQSYEKRQRLLSELRREENAETRLYNEGRDQVKRDWQLEDRADKREYDSEEKAKDRELLLEDRAEKRQQTLSDRESEREHEFSLKEFVKEGDLTEIQKYELDAFKAQIKTINESIKSERKKDFPDETVIEQLLQQKGVITRSFSSKVARAKGVKPNGKKYDVTDEELADAEQARAVMEAADAEAEAGSPSMSQKVWEDEVKKARERLGIK